MPALCLSELERDLSLQPQPKWQMNDAGQWVQRPIIRTRANGGWTETPIRSSDNEPAQQA
jgi:hypothetical protein